MFSGKKSQRNPFWKDHLFRAFKEAKKQKTLKWKDVGAQTISIYFLHVYENKYYIQVYLQNCTYKIVDNEIVEYILIIIFLVLMKINFLILMNGFYKCYITIKLTYVK